MTFRALRFQPARRAAAIAPALPMVLAACFLLTACGGGDGDFAQSTQAAQAERKDAQGAPAFVQVRGCVLDEHFIPRTGTPVRALASDGRLLAQAASDAAGRFTLRLPAGATATLAVDLPGGESQRVRVGGADLSVETCLADGSA